MCYKVLRLTEKALLGEECKNKIIVPMNGEYHEPVGRSIGAVRKIHWVGVVSPVTKRDEVIDLTLV